jgi:hypothetical protein
VVWGHGGAQPPPLSLLRHRKYIWNRLDRSPCSAKLTGAEITKRQEFL